MLWIILALSLISAAPVLLFTIGALISECGAIPIAVASGVVLLACVALPAVIALCTALLALTGLAVYKMAVEAADDTTETTRS